MTSIYKKTHVYMNPCSFNDLLFQGHLILTYKYGGQEKKVKFFYFQVATVP